MPEPCPVPGHHAYAADACSRCYCPVYGHDHYPAATCPGCRTDFLTTGHWPTGTRHEGAHRTHPTDHAERAAGERQEP